MKLLLISQNYSPEGGAASIRLTTMVNSLKEGGIDFDVLTTMPNYPKGVIFDNYKGHFFIKEKIDDVDVYRYWLFSNQSYNALLRLFSMLSMVFCMSFFFFNRRLMKSYNAVVVQTPQLPVAYFTVFLCKLLYKKKIILNVSDVHPSSLVDSNIVREGSLYYKALLHMEMKLYKWAFAYIGQSNEILNHIAKYQQKSHFLYRTLQKTKSDEITDTMRDNEKHNKLVYAGLLSKTQDIVSILKNIDFKSIGAELHIYGEGVQKKEVMAICDNVNTFYHGSLPSSEMNKELKKYHASIIPLSTAIYGAVPSKIYNVVASGLPVLYLGKEDGEAATIITYNNIGLVSPAYDFKTLESNISKLIQMSRIDYEKMVDNCHQITNNEFNFEKQIVRLKEFISEII